MSLKLILGCMYSGKTTEILRIVNSLKHIGETPLIIKPIIDDRYSKDKISTELVIRPKNVAKAIHIRSTDPANIAFVLRLAFINVFLMFKYFK